MIKYTYKDKNDKEIKVRLRDEILLPTKNSFIKISATNIYDKNNLDNGLDFWYIIEKIKENQYTIKLNLTRFEKVISKYLIPLTLNKLKKQNNKISDLKLKIFLNEKNNERQQQLIKETLSYIHSLSTEILYIKNSPLIENKKEKLKEKQLNYEIRILEEKQQKITVELERKIKEKIEYEKYILETKYDNLKAELRFYEECLEIVRKELEKWRKNHAGE